MAKQLGRKLGVFEPERLPFQVGDLGAVTGGLFQESDVGFAKFLDQQQGPEVLEKACNEGFVAGSPP